MDNAFVMLLDERHAIKYINRKFYPYWLGGVLCALTILILTIVFLIRKYDLLVSIAGIEILLYMILNCVSGLIVSNIRRYFKVTVIAFLINVLIVFGYIYLLIGSRLSTYSEYLPILEAFIFSFFGSFILIVLIRNVISFLKE